jgi:hypothetical protein
MSPRRVDPLDRLPPFAPECEMGLLGCVMLEPVACLNRCAERFAGAQPFYDLRHAAIFEAFTSLHAEGAGIELTSVVQRLRDMKRLEEVGGPAFIGQLELQTPSATNLDHYLEVVWEKYLARRLIQQSAVITDQVIELDGVSEPLLSRVREMHLDFEAELSRGSVSPRFLKPAADYCEEVWEQFFGANSSVIPGLNMPIEFTLKVRPGECTLMTGDDGSGKSVFLNYTLLWLASQGWKACTASFEVEPATTLWGMICQSLGTRELPDSEAGRKLFTSATSWLAGRLLFYSFLGIADWRDVLDSFRYAARHLGCKAFLLDSVMRVGIPDDDYAMQGLAAARFAQFAQEEKVHLFLVIHENKGAEKGKSKVRGSKLWTANCHNVVKIEINSAKGVRLDEIRADLVTERQSEIPSQDILNKLEKEFAEWRGKWDARLILLKQRYPGAQQNAAKYVYFDRRCFQFREHREDPPVNWIERWKRRDPPVAPPPNEPPE